MDILEEITEKLNNLSTPSREDMKIKILKSTVKRHVETSILEKKSFSIR